MLTKLYSAIAKQGIRIFEDVNLSKKAGIIEIGGKFGIFVNPSITDEEEKFMLVAHEYGHFVSGTLHKLNAGAQTVAECERVADAASVFEILPFSRLKEGICTGVNSLEELSYFLYVPKKFIELALRCYKDVGYKVDEIEKVVNCESKKKGE